MGQPLEQIDTTARSARCRAPDRTGTDWFIPIPADFRLDSGERLPDREFRTRVYGPADAPLVIVAGGISAGRIPYAPDGSGWWQDLVGPGLAIDVDRWRVLAFDFAPLADAEVAVSTNDQARLVDLALTAIGEDQAYAWAGASYGGMIGLAFAALAPERLGRLCVISAAHRPSVLGMAWRGIQRRIAALAAEAGRPEEGLALARELAMTTYRGAQEFETRFDRRIDDEGLSDVCRYLISRGRAYPSAIAPKRWAALSASIDRHAVAPEAVETPTTLIASITDRLTPLSDMRDLAERLPDLHRFAEIDSLYGHDAFLKDVDRLTPLLRNFLDA
ncbi:MAG TPA: homoserine O-succinyltransferase [Caulobacteraceae bacterium]